MSNKITEKRYQRDKYLLTHKVNQIRKQKQVTLGVSNDDVMLNQSLDKETSQDVITINKNQLHITFFETLF
ncbi:CLUMA_CG012372, isoform A [Clunio marinus]|uniref:CLUMA_CG012372, isoform A n=1 Tax=Clunio marinus TaxID=568069 RepID=A0A1J1IE73_9DIPT|nr:CLUMA_CG012372, isoform A [Clunio marinus]